MNERCPECHGLVAVWSPYYNAWVHLWTGTQHWSQTMLENEKKGV